ncbi:hypothetical protein KIPB_001348 [Kipferlia bialata]|uniref:Uncharacterized protein n=1 Tax=Kipferlia bialata TaxID=797122 RepID=A0A9K3GDI1_9EUKA|nr:hypothetical protein KIPB_000483 [Kipferlia bialata]GIQ80534.1 hypothetical protein KIPB_001348 [Kipferlia bialata]|eukprot:g483.t1
MDHFIVPKEAAIEYGTFAGLIDKEGPLCHQEGGQTEKGVWKDRVVVLSGCSCFVFEQRGGADGVLAPNSPCVECFALDGSHISEGTSAHGSFLEVQCHGVGPKDPIQTHRFSTVENLEATAAKAGGYAQTTRQKKRSRDMSLQDWAETFRFYSTHGASLRAGVLRGIHAADLRFKVWLLAPDGSPLDGTLDAPLVGAETEYLRSMLIQLHNVKGVGFVLANAYVDVWGSPRPELVLDTLAMAGYAAILCSVKPAL